MRYGTTQAQKEARLSRRAREDAETPTVKFNAHPHHGQAPVWNSAARFRDLCCGRRWGKTYLDAAEALRSGLGADPYHVYKPDTKPRVWIVAPTFKVADENWSMPGGVLDMGRNVIERIDRTNRCCWLKNGGIIEVRTAAREENLRGGGLDLLIIDEAGQVSEAAWRALRPTVSDRKGRVLRNGTPRGRGWWYKEWKRGQGGVDGLDDHASWQSPSNASPYFPDDEWADAKRDMPLDWFRQEYEAQFLSSQAAVFRGLDACLVAGDGDAPNPRGGRYVHGLDIAKQVDFSVLVTVEIGTGRIVHIQRLQRIEYIQQAEIFKKIVDRYPGEVWADSTGVGPALIEPLALRGVRTHSYAFTEQSKRELVGNLIVGIESKSLRIPTEGDFAVMVEELRDFEYKLSGTGQPRYGAPDGLHDDTVFALALGWWGVQRGGATFVREPAYGMR